MKNYSTEQGCAACGKCTENGSALHHLYTRKSRPDLQIQPWNLIPVCQAHHNEFHSKGTLYMSEKYEGVFNWLKDNDWNFDTYMNKWYHKKARNNED